MEHLCLRRVVNQKANNLIAESRAVLSLMQQICELLRANKHLASKEIESLFIQVSEIIDSFTREQARRADLIRHVACISYRSCASFNCTYEEN